MRRRSRGPGSGYRGWRPKFAAQSSVLSPQSWPHRDGTGAKLLAAANARGIRYTVAQVYVLPDEHEAWLLEQLFKARGHTPERCERCKALRDGRTPAAEPVMIEVVSVETFIRTKRKRSVAEVVDTYLAYRQRRATRGQTWDNPLPIQRAGARPLPSLAYLVDPATAYPLELIGPDFDLDALRDALRGGDAR